MSRTTKRFLSILLAAAMILSLGITGWAIDDEITIVEPEARPAVETDKHVTDGFDGGTELELEEIDPSTLSIPKLGEIEEEEAMKSETLPYGLNDIVRVSIVLDDPATMAMGYSTQNIAANSSAMAYRRTLKNQQAAVEAAIANAGVTINVKWNLTLAVNIISAEVRYGDIETIEAVPGVKEVWIEQQYEPQQAGINTVITTENMVGAGALWREGYTGAGSRVAIIDTGTNQDHISFQEDALMYALDEIGFDGDLLGVNEIRSVLSELNANNKDGSHDISSPYYVYKNAKIPYAFNYVDGNNTTDHDSDNQGEHGSHVSGIAAANRYIKQDGKFVEAATSVFAVGVAPDAQILTMKVFGAGGGAYDSDYMAAIEDAIILKADSVNLSLGSGNPGMTFSDGYQEVMDSLIECGTVVAISAGNSYDWAYNLDQTSIPYLYLDDVGMHTGGSPGSFTNSLTVAAAQNIGVIGTPLSFSDYDKAVFFTETEGYGNAHMSSIPGTYEFVLVDGPGVNDNNNVGRAGDAFLALGSEVVSGKIALCYRGTSSFYAKANAAAAQGAVGVIIINNTDGTISMNLTGYEYSAPAVSITKLDGDAIKAAATPVTDDDGNVLYYTGTVTVSDKTSTALTTERSDATITDFSSWGVPGSLILKPEITAPGGNIWSVNGMTDDQYEDMSGTSMAAPHVTGMAALLGQYIRENNLEEITGQNRRTLINSLLMSTSTPMIVDGAYLPVIQQGAGLGDTYAATKALSYILMGDDATASAKDGKVKAELGQDAARAGEYSFSFTVNNFSDTDLVYNFQTDLFTQAPTYYNGQLYMLRDTMDFEPGVDFDVSYAYPETVATGHDVNKDGKTDEADAQAILDYLTGAVDGEDLDLEAAELDGVEGISSADAQRLLKWEEQQGVGNLLVPAGGSVPVTVSVSFTDDVKEFLDYYYGGGAYVEGFTYVLPVSETEDGELLDVAHSIPILGFYGSWTDASMFDTQSPIDLAYGSTKESYTGNYNTNYLTVNYGSGNSVFMGNPYAVEEEFPVDRLAVSGTTKLVNFKYNLIRNAANAGWLALDEDLNVLGSNIGGEASGAWYYVNGATWYDTATQTAAVNTTPLALGLREGDVFSIGYFAIPEYYGMLLSGNESNTVTDEEIAQLLADGELGAGSNIGFTFTVDDTEPEATAVLSEEGDKITVTAKDNSYIAFVGILDVGGNVVYAQSVPEQSEPGEEVEVTFDVSELELPNGVAIFVGDYAANEKAYLVIFDPDKPVTASKIVWQLTDTLEAGKQYIIGSSDEGSAYVLASQGTDAFTTSSEVAVNTDEEFGTYIENENVDASFVWDADGEESFQFFNANDGGALGYYTGSYPYANWSNPNYADDFVYQDGYLLYAPYAAYGIGIGFDGTTFNYTDAVTPIYLYTPVTLEIEIDPTVASEVIVSPEAATLIVDVIPTVQLTATVNPIVLPDRTVTWTSSDEEVATVDENGLVTAVAPGTAVITAASNQTPEVVAEAVISVAAPEPMDATVFGQVAFSKSDVQFGAIDLSDMSLTNYSDNSMFSYFYGGGVSGEYIYGNDTDNDFHRYKWTEDFAYDSDYHFTINGTYAVLDGAGYPSFTVEDYSAVAEEGDEPVSVDYGYDFTAVNERFLMFFTGTSLTYFRISDWEGVGAPLAVAFAGAYLDEENSLPVLQYFTLGDDGMLYLWEIYPYIDEDTGEVDGFDADLYGIAYINVLSIGEDPTAYSMSFYENEDGSSYGVLISDAAMGGIFYVDLTELAGPEIDAHFVGKIDGAINVSTLSDFDYDVWGDIGSFEYGKPADEGGDNEGGEGGERVIGTELLAKAAYYGTLRAETASLTETESFGEIEIAEPAEDDEIVIVGGLNAARNAARVPVKLDSAVLLNPESYNDDASVEVAVTTPYFGVEKEESELIYNGFVTVEYDAQALSFQKAEFNGDLQITSINDDKAGLIKIAYASLTPIEEDCIATLYFSKPVLDTEITVSTTEANDDLAVEESTVIELVATGYTITVTDYTKGKAEVGGLVEGGLYSGDVTFTVDAEYAVLAAVKTEDGYDRLECVTDEEGVHSFTVTVEADVEIALVLKGDADLNGAVKLADNLTVKQHIAQVEGKTITDPLALLAADVDGNGEIKLKDNLMIKKQIAKSEFIEW